MSRLSIIVLLAVLTLAVAIPASALDMDAKTFYGHGTLTLPMGDFGDFAGTGFGAGVGVVVPHSDVLTFRGEAGYIMYGGKDMGYYDYSFGMIPIMVLGEYQFNPDSPMYGLGGAGLTMVRSSWDYTGPSSAYAGDESDSSMELTISLGGGYRVNEQLSVEGRYNIISDSSYLSINALYYFGTQ